MRSRVGARQAFTLLEVLVAVGVFAFAVLGLMLALETTIAAASAVQRESEIRAQLESRLARLSVGPAQEVSEEAVFEGTKFVEEITREDVTNVDGVDLQGFWRVRVGASWLEGGEEQVWSVGHLVYQP